MQIRRIALVVGVLAAIAGVWWFSAREPSGARAPPPTPSAQKAAEPGEASSLEAGSATVRRQSAEAPASDTAHDSTESAALPTATVRARCVDEQGQPIAGVELYAGDWSDPAARSDREGRVSASFPLHNPGGGEPFLLRSDFRLARRIQRVVRPGDTCELFDVVLPLGGRIRGRVLGPNGKPLASVIVLDSREPIDRRGTPWIDATVELSAGDRSGAWTAGDGSFVLDGVPAGTTRVTALAKDFEPVERFPLEVVPGREVTGVLITLSQRSASQDLAFVVHVTTATGEPFPGVEVVHQPHGEMVGDYRATTDEHGCAHFKIRQRLRVDFRATDPTGRFAPAYAFDAEADSKALELPFASGSEHTLVVVDEGGAPVENFNAWLVDELQARFERKTAGAAVEYDRELLRDAHPGGRCTIVAPPREFSIHVDAAGRALGVAGPFAARVAPAEIRLVLARLGSIRGRVVHAGTPVAKAWVKLLHATGEARTIVVGAFPSRVDPSEASLSSSAEDGSFEFDTRISGEYFVQAGSEGLSDAELGPLRIDPRKGLERLLLELHDCGRIEGRVLVGAGASASDIVVGASAGEGRPRSTRTDAEGRFRLEGLSPGRWLLRRVEDDLGKRSSYEIDDDGRPESPAPSTCEVRAGEVTQLEIDLREQAEIVPEVELAGWENARWSVDLYPAGSTFSLVHWEEGSSAKPPRVRGDQPGEYRFELGLSFVQPDCALQVDQLLNLDAGQNRWVFRSETSPIAIVNPSDAPVSVSLRAELPGERRGRLTVELPAHATYTVAGLPVGRWTRTRTVGGKEIDEGTIDITAGATARLEWK